MQTAYLDVFSFYLLAKIGFDTAANERCGVLICFSILPRPGFEFCYCTPKAQLGGVVTETTDHSGVKQACRPARGPPASHSFSSSLLLLESGQIRGPP